MHESTPSSTGQTYGRPYQKLSHHLSAFDLNNTLHAKQSHLLALLYVISAEGTEVFNHLPESIQSLYLLACTELAQDCVDLTLALSGESLNLGSYSESPVI